jgi:hypothetical protein
MDSLPQILASHKNLKVEKSLLSERIKSDEVLAAAAESEEKLADVIHQIAEQQMFLQILQDALKRAGIEINEKNTHKYIDQRCRRFVPSQSGAELRTQLQKLSEDDNFKLKAALYIFFSEIAPPQMIEVSDIEIEEFYRANQQRFIEGGKIDLSFINIPKKDTFAAGRCAEAMARLRQGEKFESVAAEFDPEATHDGEGAIPSAAEISAIPTGECRVFENEKNFTIVAVRSRTKASYKPLADAAPFIAEELGAAKLSLLMQKFIAAEIAEDNVKFFF